MNPHLSKLVEEKAKELITIRNKRKPSKEEDWYLLQQVIIDYTPMARHVLCSEIRARIDELKQTPLTLKSTNRLEKLTKQLKELEGE